MSTIPTFKCVLIGNARTGKSAFLAAHLGAAIPREYCATLGVNVAPLVFSTPDGNQKIRFDVWDCAGDPRFEGLGQGYYIGADCAIIAIDVAMESASSIMQWHAKLPATIPFVVISTHIDMLTKQPDAHPASEHMYYVSSTKPSGLLAPFADLARRLANIELEAPKSCAPSQYIDPKTLNVGSITRGYCPSYISAAFCEVERAGDELQARSGLDMFDSDVSVINATCPVNAINEFLAINGILMDYSYLDGDGSTIIRRILDYIKLPDAHVQVTQEFIDSLDIRLSEFLIKRAAQIRAILRGTEHIYRDAIEKIAASSRAAIKEAKIPK